MTATLLPVAAGRDQLLTLARECCDYIVARNPYLRLVAVSGSLCRPEHEGEHEDIDFFVVTEPERIWEAFMGCLLHGWHFARRHGLDRTFFCFNYLVDAGHPEEIDLRRREYAREFLNLRVLHGADVYRELLLRHAARLRDAEPAMYRQALLETGARLAANGHHAVLEAPGAVRLAYRAGAPAFRLLAKRMEARRKRRYPGGHIYSNGRVIRSHFRRGWHVEPEEAGWLAARAFDAVATGYDEQVVATPANAHMRELVWQELSKLVRPGIRVLDLGCGTGVDVVRLAKAGATVLGIDVSPGMVEAARRNVEAAGFARSVEVRQLAIENLGSLLPDHTRRFDLILCNFGALNLAGEPWAWGPVIARLLKPDGNLVAGVMSRWCLPEVAAGLLRLRPGFALRRARRAPVTVGGVSLETSLYTPGDFERRLRGWFRLVSVRALCAFVPPPTLERAAPGLARNSMLRSADSVLGRLPALRGLGDHFLAVMQPLPAGHTLLEVGAPITASPVVADVNDDGIPEVVIAADRLHVVGRDGWALHGWPRHTSKPIASTPLVLLNGGIARIYAGSDDHGLHAFDHTGARLSGFPYPTGGDVFASPLARDFDGDGRDEIAFGSDDGCVYLIDQAGFLKPGWPVRTDGYVSASPAAARSADGREALFIGSWDGQMYALDGRGQALPGWPRRLGFPIWSTAAVVDIDGDGEAEVVVAAHRLFALRGDGSDLPGFPVRLAGYAVGSPAVGDIDGDGRPEIVVVSDRVYAFRSDGSAVPGFPVDLGAYAWASPLLVDVDGDRRPEAVVADMAGRVWAVDGAGRVLPGWPRQAGKRIAAAPTAADIDGDGYLELLVATWEGRVIVYSTEAGAGDHVASPWRAFPRREPPSYVLRAGKAGDGAGVLSQALPSASAALAHAVSLLPQRPMPYRVTDVHLALPPGLGVEAGLLYYRLGGRLHPSPLLGRDGQYFAVVQPLPPLKRLDFHFELLTDEGMTVRVPDQGGYRLTVGRRGVDRIGGR